eukprot:CAMPEP_0113620010 /NCGR_PEP_ID=MMETSP0017_2-20120614/10182_1 /TAXON_ID=2856 /ORGANISM="Cylindrotheca closterium" /LENGTH=1015 /DNA_ID=CAMNT_0000529637 /DNA_START=43 /DNA_END=3090 /DNA_ORIENTATION=+ /assembly_acc=CAM_ASM_000147
MGSETSKPVQPPEDWAKDGDQFRIISPMSDISNPSEINRVYNNVPRSEAKITDPNRRVSKTVTRALASSNPNSDIPAPSAFYFPNKDVQRGFQKSNVKKGKENKTGFKKMIKKSKKVMAGCFVSENDARAARHEPVNLQPIDINKIRSSKNRANQRNSQDLVIKQKLSDIAEEASNNSSSHNSNPAPKETFGAAEMALHQEDAYFDRLSGGPNGEVHASPYVQNTAVRDVAPMLDDGFQRDATHLFDTNNKEVADSKSQLDKSQHSKKSSQSRKSTSSRQSSESASNFVQNKSHFGLLSTENYEVQHRRQSRDPTIARKGEHSEDESSPMSYGARQKKDDNLQSAFRIPGEPLMQVAKLGGRQPRTSTGSRSSRSSRSSYTRERSVSKLESLFRPVLPALSADDASASSFDPYQIKVTESAPSQLEGNNRLGVHTDHGGNPNQLALLSPSMLSIDSQGKSPAAVKVLLSEQAVHNGDFLFTDYGPQRDIQRTRSDRNSAVGSISTAGARSRLTNRSAKAATIPSKASSAYATDSDHDYMKSDPIVRFPKGTQPTTVTIPAIESKMSDLSDFADLSVKDTSRETLVSHENSIPEEGDFKSPEEGNVRWAYTTADGKSRVTPYVKGMDTSQVTKSPFVRYQAAKEKWESQEVDDDQFAEFLKPSKTQPSVEAVTTIPEEHLQEEELRGKMSFDSEPRWSFGSNGFNQNEHAATKISQSPSNRFGNKSKFGAIKERPNKSPKATVTKRKGAGGVVTARIEALDRKVIQNRRLKKKLKNAKKTSNPRRFQVVNTSYVRTQKLNGYAPTKVDLEKLNLIGGVKFNKIPEYGDDDVSSCQSSIYMEEKKHDTKSIFNLYPHDEYAPPVEELEYEDEADDDTRASTAASTVLQTRRSIQPRASESSYSSAGSGLSRVKKQVFDNRFSLVSTGENTTMSSIIGKENQTYRPFRHAPNSVNPSKQKLVTLPANLQVQGNQAATNQGPQKWRSLAAAAQDKDSAMQGLADWKKKHSNRNHAGFAN